MILDLEHFVAEGRRRWSELEERLARLESQPLPESDLAELERFHYLYERAAADLARLSTFAAAPEVRGYLEALVARAYAEIHETRRRPLRFAPLRFLLQTFPRTFRRHLGPFRLAVTVTLVGTLFGGSALVLDPESKAVLMPFPQLQGNPSQRVAEEESAGKDRLAGARATFSAQLMTHNFQVGVLCLALGMSWGIGTLILLFYNGVILGAVALDYVRAGEGTFLAGWLLPHGTVEVLAIMIAGQAGLLLAGALLGRGAALPVRERLRGVGGDLGVLVGGFAALLAWAAIVESFLSQYHEPALPYGAKIAFGTVELILLTVWLGRGGRSAAA